MAVHPTTTTNTLKVPGATLYYEVRGTGPLLLMIPGGPADAAVFTGIADLLADRYTVVTYDPRGNSRSGLDGPAEEQRIDIHADDASRLLAALTTERAYVLASSGGAQVALELVVRHTGQVRTLVAHEPPAMELLPDRERWRAFFQEVYDLYGSAGVFPAMQAFGEGVGLGGDPPDESAPLSPEMLEAMDRMQGNLEFFVAHLIRPIGGYEPDVAALRSTSTRIVVAGGEESRAQPHPAYQATVALAERLGTEVVHFPGQHGGFGTHPGGFAETLHEVLSN